MIKTTTGSLGQRLRQARVLKEKTQQEVAKDLGIQNSALCRYELGKATPPPDTLGKLYRYLNLGGQS